MPTGIVKILYWEPTPGKLGHVALLMTPLEPQDFSDIPQQMREQVMPGQLYISFYPENRYRPYHHDTDPGAGNGGRAPDQQIDLYHLDVRMMVNKVREILSRGASYFLFASVASLSSYGTGAPTNQYNCVSYVLELLFAGGIGQYVSTWGAVERIGDHFKTWMLMPQNSFVWTSISSLSTLLVGHFGWSRVTKAYERIQFLEGVRNLMYQAEVYQPGEAFVSEFYSFFYPKGLFLRLANMYNGNRLLLVGMLALAGVLAYQIPMIIDGFKKVLIRSPRDVYELVEKIARINSPQQSPSSISGSPAYPAQTDNQQIDEGVTSSSSTSLTHSSLHGGLFSPQRVAGEQPLSIGAETCSLYSGYANT